MYRIPRFWLKFKRMMTVQDLLTGRKVVITALGKQTIQIVDKPLYEWRLNARHT